MKKPTCTFSYGGLLHKGNKKNQQSILKYKKGKAVESYEMVLSTITYHLCIA